MLKIYGIQLFLPSTKIEDAHSCQPYRQRVVCACTCAVTFSFFCSHLPGLICIGQLNFLLFFFGGGGLTSLASVALVLLLAHAFFQGYPLAGLVVKASASGAEDPGLESRLQRDYSGSSHTNDLKIGTPVATLPGAWHYRVSSGTGRPGVSIL